MATAANLQLDSSQGPSLPAIRPSTEGFEFDLLLACCTSHEPTDRILSILSRPLDWERTLHLIAHHRVVSQAYGALSPFSPLIPARTFDALRSRYRDSARKALWFAAELVRIAGHLESAGIKALPYKGPVLAQTLYGEITQRQFSDLDILILPEDVHKAKAASLDLGYKTQIDLAPHIQKAFIETGYEHSFRSQQGSNLLELQWRITPRFYCFDFDVARLFQRAGEINFGGRLMRTLRLEDLLLVLCVHAAKHVWVQLSWLCDIAQLAKSPQLDWNAMQDEAGRLGIKRIVHLNLLLAHKLLGTPLPECVPRICHSEQSEESAVAGDCKNADYSQKKWRHKNKQISPGDDLSTTALADEILLIIARSTDYNTESLPYFRLMMRLRERRQDQARFLWRLALTPSVSEWSTVSLSKPLRPLYRLIRLSRLAKRLASVAPTTL
jgi:hypothetical protein